MSTESTAQQTPAPVPAGQGTHHYVLTMQTPHGGALSTSMWSGTCSPRGTTRYNVMQALIAECVGQRPEMSGAVVLFFSLDPNQL